MAVAAPILPPALSELDLPDEVRDDLLSAWTAWWVPLREQLRHAPPEFGSPEERLALAGFARGLVDIMQRFGNVLAPILLREGFARVFEALVREEEAQTPTLRRLGLKFVERAVDVLGELFEAAAAFAAPSLPTGDIGGALPSTNEATAQLLDAPSLAILRLELYTFIAFDLVRDEPVDEFVGWARSARAAAQAAAPYVARLVATRPTLGTLDPSADIVLTGEQYARVVDLIENPPAPSARLRRLLRGSA